MIYYCTKETLERYKLKILKQTSDEIRSICQKVIEIENGNDIYEWGVKLFYFDRRKCLQIVNFATKLTVFVVDVKVDDLVNVPNAVANYIIELYKDDKAISKAIERYFASSPIVVFDKLVDKSIIATLNHTQLEFAEDGYRFYDYIKNNILETRKINKDIAEWCFTKKINGKTEYFIPKKYFKEVILERFSK